ncbi:MAG: VWA domain-containing protein, partial [Planctomycetes bacterium]|nr:VWA domain-containing protein [Planctomycetota bacterium]
SFGVGGYHLSPVDELLPVSMEMREEQRKQGLALAVALDRSGSMGTHVASGRTKMMLANDGTCAAVELLARIDSVAVIAVDTDAHVVQPLAPAEDVDGIVARVRGIGVGGGGIYVRTALEAALAELRDAPQQNRHVVLFADAADAEEQEGCEELVADMTAAGWSLSVIALGTPADPDAVFLQGLAALGGGEAYFTTSADELPRLFAQDTLNAARATFVEEPTGVRTLADVHGLGELGALELPRLDGYNLTWLRPSATAAAVTTDELGAPVLAYAYRGAGRVAAYTG